MWVHIISFFVFWIVQVRPCTRVSFALWNSRSVPRGSQPVSGPAIRRAVGYPGTGLRAAPRQRVRPPRAFPLRANPEAGAALGFSLGLQNAPQQPRSGNLEIKTTNKPYSSHACRAHSTGRWARSQVDGDWAGGPGGHFRFGARGRGLCGQGSLLIGGFQTWKPEIKPRQRTTSCRTVS